MASSEDTNPDESRKKKIKLSHEDSDISEKDAIKAEDLSAQVRINSFEGFALKQLLSDNVHSKAVFVEGKFEPEEDSAVVLLEKVPIPKDSIEKLLNTADLALNLKSKSSTDNRINDYAFYPTVQRGSLKATIIYPATSKHIEKYKFQLSYHIQETPDIYRNIVLPHLQSQAFSLEWVYNILEHKSEADRIIFEDDDPDLGFVLLPDLKWDEPEKEAVYLIAISQTRNVKSLRDLNASHLTLLKNIRDKSLDAISKKYNIPSEKLRIFVHYQPSYYHFHVHFTSIQKQFPGTQFEKAHLLDNIIDNIELMPSYYREVTLSYTLKAADSLFLALKSAGAVPT